MKLGRREKVAEWVAPARARLSVPAVVAAVSGPGVITALAPITDLEGKQGVTALYLAAIIAATTIGGLWSGVLAAGLSLLGLDYFFVSPFHGFTVDNKEPLITGGIAFLLAVLFVHRVQQRREAAQLRAEQAEVEMGRRASRQEALASFGRIALTGASAEELYDEVVRLVGEGLRVGMVGLAEFAPGSDDLVLRAGVGWREGTIGSRVSAERDSLAGYTLALNEPVVVQDLRQDDRFPGSPILHAHGGAGAISVPIRSPERSIGVITAISSQANAFSADDVIFMRAAANMFAAAVQRHRFADELRVARDEFQALIDASPVPIVVYDRDGVVTVWNPAAEEVFGWTAEEVIGSFFPIVPDDLREEFDRIREDVYEGRAFSGYETTRLRKDGSKVEVSFSNAPVRDAVGEIRGVVGIITDVTDRKRAERAIIESEQRLRLALEAASMGWWEWDVGTGVVRWSDNLEPIHGLPHGGFKGTFDAFLELIHPDDRQLLEDAVGRALAEGSGYDLEFRVVWPDGSVHWMQGIGHVVVDEEGKPVRMLGLGRDVTDRKRREEALAFLAEAGERLSGTLDYERTLREIARLAVPRLADCCVVDILDEERSPHQLAVAHVDPRLEELVRDLETRYPTDPNLPASPMGRALRSGQAELVERLSGAELRSYARDEEHAALLGELGLTTAMFVPLTARGRTLGVVGFLAGKGRHYSPDDLALARDLARNAALSVDNARLYSQRSRVARSLQRSLLPPELPAIPGIDVAARYRAAGEGMEVGGDFYDLFETDGGGWAVVIGDVCGKGADAAAVTGLARHTIRTAAFREERPSHVLQTLNDAMLRQYAQGTFCTVAFARLADTVRGRHAVLSSGGHPLPLLLTAGGEAHAVGSHGTLLGVFPDPELEDTEVPLSEGDVLLLYTDGLVEYYDQDVDVGERRLLELLRESAGKSAEAVAGRIETSLRETGNGNARDDIAFVVLKVSRAD
jgi:PAS domain S-box-containing protein